MKLKVFFTTIFSSALFAMSYSCLSYASCFNYPTIWKIQNQSNKDLFVECRVYHGGWSYQTVKSLYLAVPANKVITHKFSDYNDGLGMLERNWSCAMSDISNMPLMRSDSKAFPFKGCSGTTMVLEDKNVQEEFSINNNFSLSSFTGAISTCPEARTIKRHFKCTSPGCTWDSYGVNDWIGYSSILSPQDLAQLKFVGVDANLSKDSVLGCIYKTENITQTLILSSYLPPVEGSYPGFRFKPAHGNEFYKNSGYLMQCFADNPAGCAMVLKN